MHYTYVLQSIKDGCGPRSNQLERGEYTGHSSDLRAMSWNGTSHYSPARPPFLIPPLARGPWLFPPHSGSVVLRAIFLKGSPVGVSAASVFG